MQIFRLFREKMPQLVGIAAPPKENSEPYSDILEGLQATKDAYFDFTNCPIKS